MPKLVRNGIVLKTFPTRAQCIVEAFEQGLVYTYGGRKNHFLLGVEIQGEDGEDEGSNPYEKVE